MLKHFFVIMSAAVLIVVLTIGSGVLIVYSEQRAFYVYCKVFGEYTTMDNKTIYCSTKKDKPNAQPTNQ